MSLKAKAQVASLPPRDGGRGAGWVKGKDGVWRSPEQIRRLRRRVRPKPPGSITGPTTERVA